MTDRQLLSQYSQTRSEPAFAELVRRHIGWVHGTAVRRVRDGQSAEDVTQAAFIALAQKASALPQRMPVASWPFRATRYAAREPRGPTGPDVRGDGRRSSADAVSARDRPINQRHPMSDAA